MSESLSSTILGKPYTHHSCLETIPSAFSKSVTYQNVLEYLDHLIVGTGGYIQVKRM